MINKLFSTVLALTLIAAAAQAQQFVTDGLVSFWTLDRSTISGNTVRDVWGDNHGTIEGAEIVEGKINEALLFNGKDSLVEIDDSESLNITEAITIDFWFTKAGKSTENVYPRPVSKGQSTGTDGAYGVWVGDQPTGLDIGFRSPGIAGVAGNDFRTGDAPDYSDGSWHHVAVAYDGESGRTYLDGVNILDTPMSGELAQTDDPLHIGDGNNQRHFNGAIDEVRIYNRALSEDEILQNYRVKSNTLAVVNTESKLTTLWGRMKIK